MMLKNVRKSQSLIPFKHVRKFIHGFYFFNLWMKTNKEHEQEYYNFYFKRMYDYTSNHFRNIKNNIPLYTLLEGITVRIPPQLRFVNLFETYDLGYNHR